MSFGENLKRIRKSRGLSQIELGEIVGRTHASLSRYERGKGNPPLELVIKLSEALGCTVSELNGEEPKIVYVDHRKVGRWETVRISPASEEWGVRCSNCKVMGVFGTPYCPMCGAKMERSKANEKIT